MMSAEYTNTCKVWSRFNGTRKDGSVVKLRIQDLEWDKNKEDIADFVMKYFITDEAFHKAAGISNNEDAITEYTEMLYFLYENQKPYVSVCYIDNDSHTNSIVGMSITTNTKSPSNKDNVKEFKPKTKEVQNLFNIVQVTRHMRASKGDEASHPINEGRGISVRPDHRGLGIANEFVRLRKQFCIDNNVQMTRAWMTSIGTQKAASKYNWQTFLELPVEELAKQTDLVFEANVPTFKFMFTTKD